MSGRRTVLLVDDSPLILCTLRVMLEGEDLDVLEAEDSERAWQLIRLLPVDLVVADINLPGDDGIQLLEKVRAAEEPAKRTIPVLLLTYDEDPGVEDRGRRAGANAFLLKGGSPEVFVGAVRRLLSRLPSEQG